jgi:ribosomal protein L11 methyltransferase
MADYTQVIFENISAGQSDILVAQLSEAGFEGFEEDENCLKAFIPSDKFDEAVVKGIAESSASRFSLSIIQETNWNEVWESNFHPVVVNDFVGIRAGFHPPIKGVMHEIVITPKMSFGTGHHATTWLMISQMSSIDFINKQVFDFGTGTGILAILAKKLGAASVIAIDNDEWSITNCRENILQNNVDRIEVIRADTSQLNRRFDVILANINKNVILDNLPALTKQMAPDGVLVLSGLLSEDGPEMVAEAEKAGLQLLDKVERHNWLCLKLSY